MAIRHGPNLANRHELLLVRESAMGLQQLGRLVRLCV
jgi:hypothetical protein